MLMGTYRPPRRLIYLMNFSLGFMVQFTTFPDGGWRQNPLQVRSCHCSGRKQKSFLNVLGTHYNLQAIKI